MKTFIALFSLLSLVVVAPSCSPLPSPESCPVIPDAIQQARTAVAALWIVCADRDCAADVEQTSEVVRAVDASAEQVCERWHLVEAVASRLFDDRISALVKSASVLLACEVPQ